MDNLCRILLFSANIYYISFLGSQYVSFVRMLCSNPTLFYVHTIQLMTYIFHYKLLMKYNDNNRNQFKSHEFQTILYCL